jgi:hypothetical protein
MSYYAAIIEFGLVATANWSHAVSYRLRINTTSQSTVRIRSRSVGVSFNVDINIVPLTVCFKVCVLVRLEG